MSLAIILLAIVGIEILAQYCARRSYQTKEKVFLAMAFLFYGLVALLLYLSYQYSTMGLVNVMWNTASTISILILGFLLFHEGVNAWDVLGIILSTIGIFIIYIKGHVKS